MTVNHKVASSNLAGTDLFELAFDWGKSSGTPALDTASSLFLQHFTLGCRDD